MGAKAKALTRKITRNQARSYERSYPNARGVTHLNEINGQGAYERRYAKTRGFLSSEKRMYTAKQRAAMKRMSPKRRAAFQKMLHKAPKLTGGGRFKRNRAQRTAEEIQKYREGHKKIFGKKPRPKRQKTEAAPKPKKARRVAAPKPKRVTRSAFFAKHEGNLGTKRTSALWKAIQTKRGVAGKKRPQKRTYAGKYRAIKATIGPKRRWTYKYKTKRGALGDIPDHALLGYRSPAAMRKVAVTGGEREREVLSRKLQRLALRRERDAERSARRIRQGLGVFSPNAGDEILSFEEWKEMRPNATRKQIAAARRNIKKAQAARRKKRGGRKATAKRKGQAKRKASAKRKSTGWTHAKRVAAGKKAARTRKRHLTAKGTVRKTTKKRKGRKSKLSAKTKVKISRALKRYHKGCKKPVKKTAGKKRSYKKNQGSYSVNQGSYSVNQGSYSVNRRRRRSYRRNVGGAMFLVELKNALKLGALVTVGYVAHRALTKVLDQYGLSKIDALNTGTMAKYRGLLSSAITGLVGIFGTLRVAPKEAVPVVAGMAASFIHGAIIAALASNESTLQAAAYLSGYPDTAGRAYGSYYSFGPHQVYAGMRGMGSYYELPPMSGFGQPLTQAAAGMGQITQAAAGMGQITQAAAGTGEYVAYNINGIGEYEELPTRSVGMMVDEGIYPNLQSAEQAMSVAEAAAGVGSSEVPLQSTINPTMIADPISDLPGGSRTGVFQGGDGIFG